jgi:hypothetical protein
MINIPVMMNEIITPASLVIEMFFIVYALILKLE